MRLQRMVWIEWAQHPLFAIPRSPHLQARFESGAHRGAGDLACGKASNGGNRAIEFGRGLSTFVGEDSFLFRTAIEFGRGRLILRGREEVDIGAALWRRGAIFSAQGIRARGSTGFGMSAGFGVDVDGRFWVTAGRNTTAAVLVNSGSPSPTSAVLVHIFSTPVQQKT